MEATLTHHNKQLLKESRRGHIARIERLIAEGANINHRGKYGHSPLIEAASLGHVDAVNFLLKAGADPTLLTDDNAPTLFYACVRGHAEVVEALLEAGANPNANRDSNRSDEDDDPGVSMLHIAIRSEYLLIIEALLKAGANTDFIDSGKDALMAATETKNAAVVDLVKKYFVSKNHTSKLASKGHFP